ncbi:Norsolorinic acid ketoreductase protein [Rutstroemia sp. NJR-2017a BVV2]|nr:Norsolorinic acid ketoreductase protein [Rutstroemia sp. NJR-2017a BVV2]
MHTPPEEATPPQYHFTKAVDPAVHRPDFNNHFSSQNRSFSKILKVSIHRPCLPTPSTSSPEQTEASSPPQISPPSANQPQESASRFTVIATVRDSTTDVSPLNALPKASNSNLIITPLTISTTSTSEVSAAHQALIQSLHSHNISKLDVVIANAGLGSSFKSTLETPLESIVTDFYANTVGPIALYQNLHPLLKAAPEAKFVVIGSILGSIGGMLPGAPSLSYGVSKAGVHYAAKKMHDEEEKIVVLPVHPGYRWRNGGLTVNRWVQTANGQNFANSIGVPAPPMTAEQSAGAILAQVDRATKTTISGTFVGYDGEVVPW